MGLRNFWIEVEIDGRKTKLRGGGKGFRLSVFVNDNNESKEAMFVEGEQDEEGYLRIKASLTQEYWGPGDGGIRLAVHPKRVLED